MINCNGLFPRADKNGDEFLGGVIELDNAKYWARANVAGGSLSLSISEMLPDGGFKNAGSLLGKRDGSIFTFTFKGEVLMLAIRKVIKTDGKMKAGTVFLASFASAKPATQADLAAMLEPSDDSLAIKEPKRSKKAKARRRKAKPKLEQPA
jgi:hypothetical protein